MSAEPCPRWPDPGDAGTYRIVCSCRKWEHVGTAAEVNDASRGHDDSPGRSHVVIVRERLS